ncbi:hypothetical protein Kisp02_59360 [Kineosporia sp. NBRC 101731]|nr:hypothetical protein Kisp02_59360 [Kineosporia sp. NBRC 101731]
MAPEPLVEPDGHGLAELAALVDSARLQIRVEHVFPQAEAVRAHAQAEASAIGKTVLCFS